MCVFLRVNIHHTYFQFTQTVYTHVGLWKNLQHCSTLKCSWVNKPAKSWQSHGKMSLHSAPGSVLIKTTLMKSSAEALWRTQTVFLLKQVWTIVTGRMQDAQTIQVLGTYTLLRGNLVLQTIPPEAKKPCAWLVLFLENMLPLQR